MKEKAKFSEWKYNQGIMKDPAKFRQSLFDVKDAIEMNPEDYVDVFKKVEEIIDANTDFMTPEKMVSVSLAASAIMDFIFNIKDFFHNIVNFKPLEAKKNEAILRCDAANAELNEARSQLNAAETKVADLRATLKKAQEELQAVEEKCALLEWKSDLAARLVNGLKDEYVRWKGNVADLGDLIRKVVSVNLISSGFVS